MPDRSLDGAAAWNFFRRRDAPDLWCAVPIERSVPQFLLSGGWRFGGHRITPGGFRLDAAMNADALNGFYLFQRVADQTEIRGDVSRHS